MNTKLAHSNRLRPSRAFRIAALASFGLALAGLSHAQSYRDAYPLVDTNSLGGLSVNLNVIEPTDAQMQQIADAGFKFVRHDLTWEGTEKSKGVYDWRVADALMAKAKAKGLRVMMLLAYGNPLYTSDTGAPNTAASRAAYARFAAAAAARYAHQGVIWEVYNEPNLDIWWKNPNAADYAALVNATADAIRAVSADEWIVGLTTEMPSDSSRAFINAVLKAPGVLAKLDGIAFHPYTQAAPETMAAQWSEVRNTIEANRPADHPVSLMAGEVGYFRAWSGVTEDVQAAYDVRIALFNLSQGIGFTNLFNYSDLTTGDWQATGGLTRSGGNAPYASYTSVQKTVAALKGYKFSKRLDLGRADDYCLLFSNVSDATDTRIVCWTAGAPHLMNVPSSPITFQQTALSAASAPMVMLSTRSHRRSVVTVLPRLAASATGLAVDATGDATVFASNGPNPLLAVAAAWPKLPAALTLSTRTDAIAQLGSLLVNPAWASMPAGATLKIEDLATPVPGYNRPSFTTTLSNLSSLSLRSPTVQSAFNSLGALQDEMDKPRTLKFTISLPDGTSVTQSAAVVRKQPMAAFATTPQNGALTLRVENPTGAPFQGSVKASTGATTALQSVSFAQGETYKMAYFPTIASSLVEGDLNFGLYDFGPNAVAPSSPAVESAAQTVYRTPNFSPGNGWGLSVNGPSKSRGNVALGFGVADYLFITGGATVEMNYSFGAGNGSCFIALTAPAGVTSRSYAKVPLSIGMWVRGDGSRNGLRTQWVDSSNQTFQATYGTVDWTGWKWVSIPIQGNLTEHWGGANDGAVHGSIRPLTPLIFDSNGQATSGRISMFGMTIVGQK